MNATGGNRDIVHDEATFEESLAQGRDECSLQSRQERQIGCSLLTPQTKEPSGKEQEGFFIAGSAVAERPV